MAEASPATLGTRIRAARLALGLTQTELAAALGMPQSAVSGLETGRYLGDSPALATLIRVARALDVSADHLLGIGD